MPNGLSNKEYPIKYKIQKNSLNSKINTKNNNYNGLQRNSDINIKEKTTILNNYTTDSNTTILQNDNNLNDIYKEELINFVKNLNSIYPPIRGSKYGETVLENIYNYLISTNKYNSNERKNKHWRQYILEVESKIRNIKKNQK